MENLKVLTKMVQIEGEQFVLVSFDASEGLKQYYGDRVFGLVNYKHLDERGCLNKPLMNGELAVSATPADAISRKQKDLICQHWRAAHPDATEHEFMQFVLSVYSTETN
jgi:hypothetical protein